MDRYTTEELKNLEKSGGDKTDWQRVHHMTDEDIRYDEDSPEITEKMFLRLKGKKRKLNYRWILRCWNGTQVKK
jgi:hypothetical protein